jgi:hypothetical protein
MKRLLLLVTCALVLAIASLPLVLHLSHATPLTRVAPSVTVCTDTGLTGPALQENLLYCATNALTGTITNCCTSTYQQAIHLAQQKSIIVGTPLFLSQTVDWVGRPVTYVRFNSGFYAWHYDPSNGIATIEDPYNHVVYSGR